MKYYGNIILLLCVVSLLLVCGCDDKKKQNEKIDRKSLTDSLKTKKILHLGLGPAFNEVEIIKAYKPLADYIEEKTGYKVEFVWSSSNKDKLDMLREKKIDITALGPFLYVEAKREMNILPLAVEREGGYQSCIIIRKDSGIKKWRDLKGKVFAFTDTSSTSGYLFPQMMLAEHGLKKSDFKEVIFTGKHDSAFLAVFLKQADAAGITLNRFFFGKRSQSKELMVISISELIPGAPFVVREGLDSKLVDKIKESLIEYGFTETNDKVYDSIRKMESFKSKLAEGNYEVDTLKLNYDIKSVLNDEKIGFIKNDWIFKTTEESSLGDWSCDALLEYGKTNIALQSYKHDISPDFKAGDITTGDVWSLTPLPYKVVTFNITGDKLLHALELNCKRKEDFLYVSNVIYKFDSTIESENKILEVIIDGKPLNKSTNYSVTTTMYVLNNSSTLLGIPRTQIKYTTLPHTDREVFINAIKKQKIIDTNIKKRAIDLALN